MPKRTNRFQEIVAAIERAFAPKCARITTSEMVYIKDIGDCREIDVVVEVGPQHHRIKIAVEAKDHRRKLDITAIDAILGKYRGEGRVPIDNVVFVARGFTKTAYKRAKLEGITLLTLQETREFDWVTIGPSPTPVIFPPPQCPLEISVPPRIEKIEFEPELDTKILEQCKDSGQIILNPGTQEEKICGSPNQCAERWLKRVLANKDIVSALYHNASIKGRATVNVECKSARPKILRFQDIDYKIDCFRIHILAEVKHTDLNWSTCKIQDKDGKSKTVRLAEAKTQDGTIRIILPEFLPGMKKTHPPVASQQEHPPENKDEEASK